MLASKQNGACQRPFNAETGPIGAGGSGDLEGGSAQRASQSVLRIAVLGAPAVGKTSLVQQFVYCDCPDVYIPTVKPIVHRPSISVNDRTYETRLVDYPPLKYFPEDSLQEFASSYRGCGLRTATAYVLVFDITNELSFQYVRKLRQRLIDQGISVPTLVVANKADLAPESINRPNKDSKGNGKSDISTIVRKQWKCTYAECSAKYNWRVSGAFRELFKSIEQRDSGHKATSARVQEALRRNQCVLI